MKPNLSRQTEQMRRGTIGKLSVSGRADLLFALAYDNAELSATMARLLGYEDTPVTPREQATLAVSPESSFQDEGREHVDAGATYEPADVPFWRLESFEVVTPANEVNESVDLTPDPEPPIAPALLWRKRPTEVPDFLLLAPKRAVLTELRKISATRRTTPDIDVDAVVERVSQGRLLDQLPHRQRRAWGSTICIVEDRARRLVPYWLDQEYLVDALKNLYPPSGVTIARIWDGDNHPVIRWPEDQRGQSVTPHPGAIVLVLGDLGCLAHQGEHIRRWWVQWGRQLYDQGNPAVAVVPAKATDIAADLARTWTIVRWGATPSADVSSGSPSTERTVHHLLTLLSPAVRIEPGLLRAARCLLPEGRGDPGLEARVWQDAAIASQHSVAASWDLEQRKNYLADFAAQPEALRRKVLDLIRTWRVDLHQSVWFEEIVELDPWSRKLIDATDLEDAVVFFARFAERQSQTRRLSVETRAWIHRLAERYPARVGDEPLVQSAIHRLYDLVRSRAPETQVPEWYEPAAVPPSSNQTLRQVALWQVADQLLVQTVESPAHAGLQQVVRGSPLGIVHTASGEVIIAIGAEALDRNDFWRNDQPPAWARDWRCDNVGPWVTVRVGEVEQRLRWISPGRFWMGSPEDEEGSDNDEGPRHEVRLTKGFWLFDTPCTQALWQEVMGKNPSHFKGKERPVEQVSWRDTQTFLAKLNAMLPGLALRLPTEAEWEYACRAGTETARYDEDVDAIAWYAANSSGETHEVKQKRPNTWGLYDMLGNVDEWCQDGLRTYTKAPQIDPVGPTTTVAGRVIRGGYWGWGARDVRAAYRYDDHPGFRDRIVGFRCASSSESQPVMERLTWSVSQRQAKPAKPATRRPPARSLNLNSQPSIRIEIPDEGSFRVGTDHHRLRFGQISLPKWASEIGRDASGLWVVFEVSGVRQRMRRIPPGQFWMGSPESETGRFANEGPRHEVQLTKGFWLFDTPCTQALWHAVMKENPSHFKGKTRPVEQVSWQSCQRFMVKLNALLPGLALRLPTEAEWEYACRAGTDTARHAENLDAIAWYGGKSSSGTHDVGQKQPNAWGLHDTLGNVGEWCEDGQRRYTKTPQIDPLGPTTPDAHRVIRGGSWFWDARVVRAACRDAHHPGYWSRSVGFRCASSDQASQIMSREEPDGVRARARSETAAEP